jgi:hypothetical protein
MAQRLTNYAHGKMCLLLTNQNFIYEEIKSGLISGIVAIIEFRTL